MPTARLITYAEDVRAEDTQRAMQTVTVALVPDEAAPVAVEFSGNCPRCEHPIESREWLVSVAASLRVNDQQMSALVSQLGKLGVDLSRGDETFDLVCSCNQVHPDRPKDKQGCGARFRVRVVWP
jgi:hypothetical protein